MNLQYPVSTIDDMYYACDPDDPLAAINDVRYQDLSCARGKPRSWVSDTVKEIKRTQKSNKFFSMLFSGHRGSGKTTELYQLKAALEKEQFFVVYLDIEVILELNDIEYKDILLAVAGKFYDALEEKGWKLNTDLLKNLEDWFVEKVVETERKNELMAEINTEIEAGVKTFFGSLMARFTAALKNSASQREFIRQKIESDLTIFKLHLQTLITNGRLRIRQEGFKDVVIIVDGLEKMLFTQKQQYSNHYELFVLCAEQLKWVNSHVIYTVPITLPSQTNLLHDFYISVMPMVNFRSDSGKKALRDLIAKRVNIVAVFEDENYVNELIALSGGAIRDLMILLRSVTETDAPKVSHKDVQYAKNNLIKFYSRQLIILTETDKQILRAVYQKQSGQNMESYARLTYNRVILEYENGELWQALHPAVLELEAIKKLLAAD